MTPLTLTLLPDLLAICRLPPDAPLPEPPDGGSFWSVTRTREEISLVLADDAAPAGWQAERGWRGLKVEGPLAFELTGILASLAGPLAKAGVSLFALSTYDTDYVLVKENDLSQAIATLQTGGHTVVGRTTEAQ